MKIRNNLFENIQWTEIIGKIHNSDKLSVMDAYRINRLVKKLGALNEEYLGLKQGLFKKFGTPGEVEGEFQVEEDNRKPFLKEMSDLLTIEHDLEMDPLNWPSALEDGFSARDLNVLEIFFNLEEIFPSLPSSKESPEKEVEITEEA